MAPFTCPWKYVSRNPAEPTRRAPRGSRSRSPPRRCCRSPGPAARGCGGPPATRPPAGRRGRCVARIRGSWGSWAFTISVKWGAANGGRRRREGIGWRSASAISRCGKRPRPASWRRTRPRAASAALGWLTRVVPPRRARQRRQQGDLSQREPFRLLAEVEPRRRPDPLDVAAVGSQVQVQLQDLVLGKSPFELKGAEALADLGRERPGPRLGHARDLHGDGRGARHHLAASQVRPRRPHHRQAVDAGMPVEPPVLRGHQRLRQLRRQLREADRKTPAVVRRQEEPQRLAVAVRRPPRRAAAGGSPRGTGRASPASETTARERSGGSPRQRPTAILRPFPLSRSGGRAVERGQG